MDESKLTKKDKEEIVEGTRELLLGFIERFREMLEELKEEVKKC